MAEKKRQCGTCRFFATSDPGGHGKCTHPKRDMALREMVLLRPNELGCRTRWGTSLWQDPADESDPVAPDVPQQPVLPEPISAQMHYDDEVTSVSIAGSKSTRSSFEDDVVDSGAVASGVGSWNDTLQEERRRLLRYSERDALAGARKRHIEKQSRQRELIPFADDAAEAPKNEEPAPPADEPQQVVAASKPNFPPDDYVEEERSSEADTPVPDDALVDDGVRPGGTRSPRSRRLMRETKSPKDHKAMGLGLPAEMAVTSHNPEKREQWNSVPAMTPGFELPFVTAPEARPSTPLRISASAAPIMSTQVPSRPVSQARELVSEDRLRQERARRHVDVPLADDRLIQKRIEQPQPSVTNRPRLSEAPAHQEAQVDRLKSSPLRGYHPAVKAAAARTPERGEQPRPHQEPMGTGSAPTNAQPVPEVRQQSRQPQIAATPETRPMQARNGRAPEQQTVAPVQREQPRPERPQRRPLVPAQPVRELTKFQRTPIAIAPDVSRTCGTCTSFRPSGVEGRGSCTNPFAGPVQRVVYAEDLACQHTFGSFWLPSDEEVWLEELKEHDSETPRVDRMIARRKQRINPVLPDIEELTS